MDFVRSADSMGTHLPSVDVPRTLVNVAALVAIAICLGAAFLRIVTDGPVFPGLTYASLAAIEIGWLAGQAILITSQD